MYIIVVSCIIIVTMCTVMCEPSIDVLMKSALQHNNILMVCLHNNNVLHLISLLLY